MALIAIIVAFLVLIAALIFFIVTRGKGTDSETTDPLETITVTPTFTNTPANTATMTPLPTWTPLPPIDYVVKAGETCLDLGLKFNVSVQSIIDANNLLQSCVITEGMALKIPQPTPTASPVPTATPEAIVSDLELCTHTDTIIVDANMTLSGIAANYNVSMMDIRIYNNLTSDIVRQGDKLVIPFVRPLANGRTNPDPPNAIAALSSAKPASTPARVKPSQQQTKPSRCNGHLSLHSTRTRSIGLSFRISLQLKNEF